MVNIKTVLSLVAVVTIVLLGCNNSELEGGAENKDLQEIAKEQGITLTPKHWEVIKYVQDKQAKGEAMSIRGIKNSGVINIKDFYNLFPGGPLKKATMIAGIPKPKSCI